MDPLGIVKRDIRRTDRAAVDRLSSFGVGRARARPARHAPGAREGRAEANRLTRNAAPAHDAGPLDPPAAA
ncbi:MAG TPA: hypothetical protein P5163_02425 [Rubrivivax sp.]|nr:hypothetical protein [Rubrivivax sp.]HRY87774.1 hypothetical protein [Rubrivivax sp.]HRZ59420.1 hypothetical protein [Rubrivivax sp.]